MKAILSRLEADTALTALLGATVSDPKIYALSADGLGPHVIFTNSPQTGGHVRQNTLELRVTCPSNDYDLAQDIAKRLEDILDFREGAGRDVGWTAEGINIMSSGLAGGGELDMGEAVQRTLIFAIKWRYI